MLDVVGGCAARLQFNCLADHKHHGLGFSPSHCVSGRGASLGLVQHLMRQFVDKGAEVLARASISHSEDYFRCGVRRNAFNGTASAMAFAPASLG